MPQFESYLEHKDSEIIEQLKAFLRYSSISTLTEHTQDIQACAEFVAECANLAGFEHVRIIPTAGHPVVYADWLNAPGKPTVLVYGHYDVQPADPYDLWESPPFEPIIRDGKIFARGATDDKGQVLMHIKAFEALLKSTGTFPLNIKLCIEGEEEVGSPNLAWLLSEEPDTFRADIVVISDTTMLGPDGPSVCYGLRGHVGIQIDVRGASSDLHSGLYGGGVPNSIHALVRILDSLHDETGRVAVRGFYNGVIELSESERKALQELHYDDASLMQSLELRSLHGEPGYNTAERICARPTLEINGVYGGFQGKGMKTVIPSEGHAKITCRLVPNQEPHEIENLIEQHVVQLTPSGVHVSVTKFESTRPFVVPTNHPSIQLALEALEQVYKNKAVLTRMGGSIPIVDAIAFTYKCPVVLMGFGLPDENMHAPNEHFSLLNFRRGMVALGHYWTKLASIEW